MAQVRVGFLSSHNYLDRNAWSGTIYRMHDALRSTDLQVINLGNPRKPSRLHQLTTRLLRKNSFPKIGSPRYIAENNKFAAIVQSQLSKTYCDVILAPVASKEITFLKTNIPIIYLSDITFKLYNGYYPDNSDNQELEWKAKQEFIAISKASKLVYPSEWAANSAIHDYQAAASKVEIIPFGANLDDPPSAEEVDLNTKPTSPCRLLFIGKDWERKGGDVAFQTLISLQKMGIDTELTCIGSIPSDAIKHEKLTVIPFLNKNNSKHRQQFKDLFGRSHFLIFPTRAEAFGVVICEANAFGLPVITTEAGGIPSIIATGKNGYMLPLSASGEDFASLIANIFSDQNQYEQLVRSSRKEYDCRLNWNKWAERIEQIITDIV